MLPLHQRLRSYRARQQWLWQATDNCSIVYHDELVSETYNKTIVHADGTMTHNVSLPAVLWLGNNHVCAYINLPFTQLLVLHGTDAHTPLNMWWQTWCARDASLPHLRGDIMLARRHTHYTHDEAVFASVM